MPKWPWEDKKEDEKVELPKELEDKFTSVKTDVTTEVTKKIDERFQSMQPVIDYVKSQQERQTREDAAEVEKQRKAKEKENETTDEDLAAELLTNPKKAISEATKPQTTLMLQLRADNIRREVFQDRAADFPYYDGDIKREVDAMLKNQSLAFQNDAASVENVYHTIVGRKTKEIQEGKIKTRFAFSSSTSSSGPKAGENDEKEIKITPEIERAARLSGMKPEEYTKLMLKDEDFDYV